MSSASMTLDQAMQMGIAHHLAGRFAEAEAVYRQVLAVKEDCADALQLLGVIACQMGKNEDALKLITRAIALDGSKSAYFCNLGEVYRFLGKSDEAVAAFEAAIAREEGVASYHNNLGTILAHRSQMDEAIAQYGRAIELDPQYSEPYNNLGNVYLERAQHDLAIAFHRKSVEIRPTYAEAYSNLLRDLNYHPAYDRARLDQEHRAWWRDLGQAASRAIAPHANPKDPHRPLRIGYVSGDFKTHSVAYFFEPILAHHNRTQYPAVCYSTVSHPDDVTRRIQSQASGFRSIVGWSDEQAAALIRSDQIDILVDLSGHTSGNRLMLFARRPAPVQATYLGYPSTSGLLTMDWRITDDLVDPPGAEIYGVEKLARMPRCAWCYRPPADAPPVAPMPALLGQPFTFGSFNSFAKLNAGVIDAFARILTQTPGSRLLIKAGGISSPSMQQFIFENFAQRGVESSRVLLHDRVVDPVEHLKMYGNIDLALDPFPYNGTTTTAEALWMGAAVLSMVGSTPAGRVGLSLLSNVGMPELLAASVDEYVARAVELAHRPQRLAELRQTLRARMSQSPLMNEVQFARDLESLYRVMWQRWCV